MNFLSSGISMIEGGVSAIEGGASSAVNATTGAIKDVAGSAGIASSDEVVDQMRPSDYVFHVSSFNQIAIISFFVIGVHRGSKEPQDSKRQGLKHHYLDKGLRTRS